MKMYLVVWTTPEFPPSYYLFKTREAAEKKMNFLVGEYIIDCIKDKNVEEAQKWLEDFTDADDNGLYGHKDELYIEELEVED